MSSNLKVNTILPSTGTAIGIGTASGNVDVLGHIVGHNTPNISGINSVTASHFYGNGANLTGLSGVSVANQADNRLITATGTTDALNGESGLTFDGSQLVIETSAQNNLKINSSNSDGPNIHFERSGSAFAYLGSAAANTGGTATDLALRAQGNLLFATNGGNERVRVNSTGNVSIGGIDPVATSSAYDKASLHIHQTNSGSNKGSQIHLSSAHTGSAAGDGSNISVYATSLYINNQENGDTHFYNNGSPTATIKANGSFGIGTQGPTDKLHVNGTTNLGGNTYLTNAYVSGGIYLGGSAAVNKLEDYEEGNWTPNLAGLSNTPAFAAQQGKYTKIGRLVNLAGLLQGGGTKPLFTSQTDILKISGVPFAPNGSGYRHAYGSVTWQNTDWYGTSHNAYNYNQGQIQVGMSGSNLSFWISRATHDASGALISYATNKTFHNKDFLIEYNITYMTDA